MSPYRQMAEMQTGPRWGATWLARLRVRLFHRRVRCWPCGSFKRWDERWYGGLSEQWFCKKHHPRKDPPPRPPRNVHDEWYPDPCG